MSDSSWGEVYRARYDYYVSKGASYDDAREWAREEVDEEMVSGGRSK